MALFYPRVLNFQGLDYPPSYTEFLIAVNTLLLCNSLIIFGLHYLFYGPFEPAESEELYAKFVPATLESIMTVIILDVDVDIEILLLFTALLAARTWVWIGEWMVESLHQERTTRMRTYVCMLIAVLLSLTFEAFMMSRIFHATRRTTDAKILTMFGFEHAILSVSDVSILLSAFSLFEEAFLRLSSGVPKDKRRWMLSLNAIRECIVLFISVSYLLVCLISYKRPIITSHIFATSLSLIKRFRDSLNYQWALKEINERNSDATAEQIVEANVCAICYEHMWPWEEVCATKGFSSASERATPGYTQATGHELMLRTKRLPCGHIFHFGCLKSWFEMQATCPQCRKVVSGNHQFPRH